MSKAYKQAFIDKYYEKSAQPLADTMGFYWAMRARDFIPVIAKTFKSYLWMLQEPTASGEFPIAKTDTSQTCFQDFQEWLDVCSTKSTLVMYEKFQANRKVDPMSTKQIFFMNAKLLGGTENFDAWSAERKKAYIKDSLWNFEDEMESFGTAVKEFAGVLLHKCFFERDEDEHNHHMGLEHIELNWDWTVQELWELIDDFVKVNEGLPTRNEEAGPHSEESLDIITGAIASENFLDFVVDYILKSK